MSGRRIVPHIVAIGGGEIKDGETLALDRHIVAATGRKRPRALFLPTASGDAAGYIETFHRVYGEQLGCRTEALTLLRNRPSQAAIRRKILGADLVYVGGGNTLRMMRLWRRTGVARLLLEAGRRGTILSGLSAGAICWFAHGHSDSLRIARADKRAGFIRVTALGLVDALFCPHYHREKRERSLARQVMAHRQVALACDDRAAIEIVGDRWRLLTCGRPAKAYRLAPGPTSPHIERLPGDGRFRPLVQLLSRSTR